MLALYSNRPIVLASYPKTGKYFERNIKTIFFILPSIYIVTILSQVVLLTCHNWQVNIGVCLKLTLCASLMLYCEHPEEGRCQLIIVSRFQEGDDAKTEEEILSLIAQHVKAVNHIYSETPFDGKYKHNGYQFEVQRIKIHNDSKCGKTSTNNRNGFSSSSGSDGGGSSDSLTSTSAHLSTSPDLHPFCIPNVDVSNFLNLHSQYDHEEFCLAYVFTYRDFTGGTLGLAWVASASGASGGICETYKR
jgi:hypothetical protein